MNESKTLTIQEAKDQCYRWCIDDDNIEDGGTMTDIQEVDPAHLLEKKVVLFEKEADEVCLPDADSVLEHIWDYATQEMSEAGSESFPEFLEDHFKKDVEDLLKRIKEKSKEHNASCTYWPSDIQLLP